MLISFNVQAADLLEIYQLAETADPVYKEAISSARATAELKPQARALLLPAMTINAGTFINDQNNKGGFNLGGEDSRFNSHNYSLDVTQPLFRWDRYLNLQQTTNIIKQSEAQKISAREDLIIRVAEAYFSILAAADGLEFAEAKKKALQQQLEQINQRFAAGLTAITDVKEAQAGFDRANADQIMNKNLLSKAKEELREITGKYIAEVNALSADLPLVAPEPDDIDRWADTAASQNLAVITAKYALESARQEVKKHRAGHLPTVDLVFSHGRNSSGGRFGQNKTEATNLGLQFNMPLYQGGLTRSRVIEANHRYEQSLQQLQRALRKSQAESRQAYLNIISSINRINALGQAVASSETALEATKAGFEAGTRTAVDVVVAESNTADTKREYLSAKYAYLMDGLRLRKAAGMLDAENLRQISVWLN